MDLSDAHHDTGFDSDPNIDVLVVGAGFAGLYQLRRLREANFTVHVVDAAADLGGIWHWNCYPGARVDTLGGIYQYSDPQLWENWDYTELYPSWEEVRKYFQYVDTQLDLSRDISFNTRVTTATFDETSRRWTVTTDRGVTFFPRFVVMCIGFATKPFVPHIEGLERFSGECHHTAAWPQGGLDFTDKRVGVIGTGASGVQVVQEAAKCAKAVTVFQRTPILALPMRQQQLDDDAQLAIKAGLSERFSMRSETFAGFDLDFRDQSALELTSEQRTEVYEQLWRRGGFHPWLGTFNDILFDDEANATAYAFWRDKTRERIKDPRVAEILAPMVAPHPFGTKRPSLEQDYYEAFNQDNVTLVDVRDTPIVRVGPAGVATTVADHEFDILVLATGFDALTGGYFAIDIRGTGGLALTQKWHDGVRAHLGVATEGFPNLLMVYGPQSPAGFCNGPTCAELQGDQIVETLVYVRDHGYTRIEASRQAEESWRDHVLDVAEQSLFNRADSWYMGANVPGKPREMLNYPAGVPAYLAHWRECVDSGFKGFEMS
ncbi:cyclopentanone 1,2-monooxygenase [Mycobacterium sp. Root135]|uniref:flavin-containing monooxygenase n=1 Tax=Mycobacterium sp. Root135 TaxID=1736457 RepID=UPI0006F44E2A|nr:NAD(P)/FAD-dependent oxidoreductase [Mycobacterium sp. Root135]KQY08936.1 cyclopentanone 1,2-monooxygenase [Mycobacterium sp. Root135]